MKPQLKKLAEEINQLCWQADHIYWEADKVDRRDISINDWSKIAVALNWALIEASSFQTSRRPGKEPKFALPPKIEKFDSLGDLPCHFAALQEQATIVRRLMNALKPGEIEPKIWAEFESSFENFERQVRETLYSLFIVGELTDFEVGVLIVRKPDCTFGDWVGVRLGDYMECA